MVALKPAPRSNPVPSSKQETGYGCFTRLCWMLFGNVGLIVSAVAIARHRGSFLSFADLAYGLVFLFLIWIRYIDITKMEGLTASEKPASLVDWRRYVLYLVVVAVVLWGIMHVIAYLR